MALVADLEKLDLRDGDVLVIRTFDNPSDCDSLAFQAREALVNFGLSEVLVLLCPMDVELSGLDRDMMASFGWYRREDLLPPEWESLPPTYYPER